jgi:hypothetical protein
MTSPLIDTPAAVGQTLSQGGWLLPPRSQSEVHSQPDSAVQLLVCMTPAMYKGDPFIVTAVIGGERRERREASDSLLRLIASGPLLMHEPRSLSADGIVLLMAPWSARDDVRAMALTVGQQISPRRESVDASRLDTDWVVVMHGHSAQSDMALEIRQALQAFVAEGDSLWQGARRLLGHRAPRRSWSLPLGCTVTERQEGRQVVWEVGFDDFQMLERALFLVDARLAMGRDPLLERAPASVNEDVETCMPGIALTSVVNNRDSRAQMAKLLQNMLFVLARITHPHSMPGELLPHPESVPGAA